MLQTPTITTTKLHIIDQLFVYHVWFIYILQHVQCLTSTTHYLYKNILSQVVALQLPSTIIAEHTKPFHQFTMNGYNSFPRERARQLSAHSDSSSSSSRERESERGSSSSSSRERDSERGTPRPRSEVQYSQEKIGSTGNLQAQKDI